MSVRPTNRSEPLPPRRTGSAALRHTSTSRCGHFLQTTGSERGTVIGRVALMLRSIEVQPPFHNVFFFICFVCLCASVRSVCTVYALCAQEVWGGAKHHHHHHHHHAHRQRASEWARMRAVLLHCCCCCACSPPLQEDDSLQTLCGRAQVGRACRSSKLVIWVVPTFMAVCGEDGVGEGGELVWWSHPPCPCPDGRTDWRHGRASCCIGGGDGEASSPTQVCPVVACPPSSTGACPPTRWLHQTDTRAAPISPRGGRGRRHHSRRWEWWRWRRRWWRLWPWWW